MGEAEGAQEAAGAGVAVGLGKVAGVAPRAAEGGRRPETEIDFGKAFTCVCTR